MDNRRLLKAAIAASFLCAGLPGSSLAYMRYVEPPPQMKLSTAAPQAVAEAEQPPPEIAQPAAATVEQTAPAAAPPAAKAGQPPPTAAPQAVAAVPLEHVDDTHADDIHVAETHAADMWTLEEGQMLSANLDAWAKKSGWSVVWSVKGIDYRVTHSATLRGSFLDALEKVMLAYEDTPNPIEAKVFRGNQVVQIVEHTHFNRYVRPEERP